MSSHGRRLAQTIKFVADCKKLVRDGVKDEYTRGVYNGMEYMSSLLEYRMANYINKEDYESLDARQRECLEPSNEEEIRQQEVHLRVGEEGEELPRD